MNIKSLNPMRYAGGKSWAYKYVKAWLQNSPTEVIMFVEPFAGGGGISMRAVTEGLTELAFLNEIHPKVCISLMTILNSNSLPPLNRTLKKKIIEFEMTENNLDFILAQKSNKMTDVTFQTILKSRTNFGGILDKAGRVSDIGYRWNKKNISDSLDAFFAIKERFIVGANDGIELIELSQKVNAKFKYTDYTYYFIDPPYVNAGKKLYKYHQIDHERLFKVVSKLKSNYLMTYDNCAYTRDLADKYNMKYLRINLKGKEELFISNSLDWANPYYIELEENDFRGLFG